MRPRVLAAHTAGSTDALAHDLSLLSRDASSFVLACLEKDPAARPTTAQLAAHAWLQKPALAAGPNAAAMAMARFSHGGHHDTSSEAGPATPDALYATGPVVFGSGASGSGRPSPLCVGSVGHLGRSPSSPGGHSPPAHGNACSTGLFTGTASWLALQQLQQQRGIAHSGQNALLANGRVLAVQQNRPNSRLSFTLRVGEPPAEGGSMGSMGAGGHGVSGVSGCSVLAPRVTVSGEAK